MNAETSLYKEENKSLLLYIETCAVDHGGKIDANRVNGDEIAILESWNESGFVKFGRLSMRQRQHYRGAYAYTYWCWMSPAAWAVAHEARRARADRHMCEPAAAAAKDSQT